jgi:hypothetical protein
MSIKLVKAPSGYKCESDPGEPGGDQRWSVNDNEARLLSELFRNLKVLEIGTGLGVSTRKIAETARAVITVDVDKWVADNVAPDLPSNVRFVSDVNTIQVTLDAAFLDGYHGYESTMQNIKDARRIVKKGGLIVLHDLYMRTVYNAIIDSHLESIEIRTFAGMTVAWND